MTVPINETHDPELRSWVESANSPDTEFPVQNLPLGVFRPRGSADAGRIGVAIGDRVMDLRQASAIGLLHRLPAAVRQAVEQPPLNRLMSLGASASSVLRGELSRLLRADGGTREPEVLLPQRDVELLLPAAIGNYTDFYASIDHATNVGRLFRPDNPLLPNYRHVPIAYHGRASSIVVCGTPVRRPWGQVKASADTTPAFQPSRALDYELEVGVLIGAGNDLGEPVAIEQAEQRVFGLCLLNDWSARDVQSWEYQPLGPFLAKSFATSLSPWVVTLDALAPFRTGARRRANDEPAPLPYLSAAANESAGGLDVRLEASIRTAKMRAAGAEPMRLTRSSLRDLYWTVGQMVAHHTSNGCNLMPGDLLGTGTVSGAGDDAKACLLEITKQGTQPVRLPTGEQRTYLEDGDEIVLRGYCERDGYRRIGLGECRGIVVPAMTHSKTD